MRSNKMEILKSYKAYKNVEARELNVAVVLYKGIFSGWWTSIEEFGVYYYSQMMKALGIG
jgi:hypothetical protein